MSPVPSLSTTYRVLVRQHYKRGSDAQMRPWQLDIPESAFLTKGTCSRPAASVRQLETALRAMQLLSRSG